MLQTPPQLHFVTDETSSHPQTAKDQYEMNPNGSERLTDSRVDIEVSSGMNQTNKEAPTSTIISSEQ